MVVWELKLPDVVVQAQVLLVLLEVEPPIGPTSELEVVVLMLLDVVVQAQVLLEDVVVEPLIGPI